MDDDIEMTPEMRIEFDAVRWRCNLIPDDEREAVRARMIADGRVLGDDGAWRKNPRERRADPAAVSGEIGTLECTDDQPVGSPMTITKVRRPVEINLSDIKQVIASGPDLAEAKARRIADRAVAAWQAGKG